METELGRNMEEFKTRDMNLTACLICEGVEYRRVERDAENSRRLIFVFENKVEEITRIQSQRANGTHVVSSTSYDESLRKVKTIIHS